MRMRWRIILAALGLSLFALISYDLFHHDPPSSRYLRWSSIYLDSEPLNMSWSPRKQADGDCGAFPPESIQVTTGFPPRLLMLSAVPVFIFGDIVVSGLGRLGVSEVIRFHIVLPFLIAGWFYFLGRVIDRWRHTGSPIVFC